MTRVQALGSGFVGAAVLTLLNECVRQVYDHAPRIDVIGIRGIAKAYRGADQDPPSYDTLYWLSLAGDLVSNSLYYSLVATDEAAATTRRGLLLGLAAGIGAVVLPRPMGLGRQPNQRFPITQLLTALWYFSGGLAAATTYNALRD